MISAALLLLLATPAVSLSKVESDEQLTKSERQMTKTDLVHWRGDDEVYSPKEMIALSKTVAGYARRNAMKYMSRRVNTVASKASSATMTALNTIITAAKIADKEIPLTRDIYVDANGNGCTLCGWPDSSRLAPGQKYKHFRTDCGSKRDGAHIPEQVQLEEKLVDMNKDGTNAFCELNVRKSCADAIANKDYLYFAKSLDISKLLVKDRVLHFDGQYCLKNGWLEPEIVELVHSNNFEKLKAKGRHLCDSKYDKYNWKNMTLAYGMMTSQVGNPEIKEPTEKEAEFLAAFLCAMGDVSCDMAYCAYTYCDIGAGQTTAYGECPGWDPVNGMRKPTSKSNF